MKPKDLIKTVFKDAIELASDVPEPYQAEAFGLAAQYLLTGHVPSTTSEQSPPEIPGRDRARTTLGATSAGGSREAWEEAVLKGIPEAHLVTERGSRQQHAMWAVLALFAESKPATSETVRKLLKSKLGISPESPNHTSDRLKALVPKYLSRDVVSSGRGFEYKPTSKALEIFADLKP